jgi:hypothetical protein
VLSKLAKKYSSAKRGGNINRQAVEAYQDAKGAYETQPQHVQHITVNINYSG